MEVDEEARGSLAIDVGGINDGRNRRVGLTEAMGSPAQADNACGAVRRGENTLDFATPTLGAAMCPFPHLASLDSAFIRADIHSR